MKSYLSSKKSKPVSVGIIKLDTKFYRILGDIGNPRTWKFPVVYQAMEGVFPERVVCHSDPTLLNRAIEAAQILEEKGVAGITTSCGFLGKFQKEIANSVSIPVITSSLLQIPIIHNLLNKDKKIGVLTASEKSLNREHLLGSGIKDIPLIIKGMDDFNYFQRVFIQNQLTDFNIEKIKIEIVNAATDLKQSCDNLGALVLECTNMSPFALDIQKNVNLPIFDIYSLVQWFYHSLVTKIFNEIE